MVPGAVEVLPSKVHSRLAPSAAILQVSVTSAPDTPKRAVAAVAGGVTDRTADAFAPP